jgi:hypothetical protein
MATRLDEKIEQLESIVEKRLNLCKAIRHGRRCILSSGHEPAQAHNFPTASSANADPVTGNHSLSRSLGIRLDSTLSVKSANGSAIFVNTFA